MISITEMEIQYLDTDFLTRGRLEVTVVRAESPLLFWVQLKNSNRDLLEMEEELQLRMNKKAKHLYILPENMKEEMDVAVKDKGIWRRGFIKGIDKPTWMVQIVLGDWGRTTWHHANNVYYLEDRFKELPWQAMICGLAYTKAPANKTIWPKRTRQLCQLLLEKQQGWINIILPLRPGAALVKLHMETNSEPRGAYNVRDALIRIGHAELYTKVTADVEPAV